MSAWLDAGRYLVPGESDGLRIQKSLGAPVYDMGSRSVIQRIRTEAMIVWKECFGHVWFGHECSWRVRGHAESRTRG